jgi:deoxyribodipyrimidine photo-lyase
VTGSPYIDQTTTVFWFRRDLRLTDNAGLYHALKENRSVLPIFIFDKEILDRLEDKADKRVDFIYQTVMQLKTKLEELGSSLLIFHGKPYDIFHELLPESVYTNHDYEPYARKRDKKVSDLLQANGSKLKTFKDQVIFERGEVKKEDGNPYTVFTPYSKKWKAKLNKFYLKSYPVQKYYSSLKKISPLNEPALETIGFIKTGTAYPPQSTKNSIIENYADQRNYPAILGTTRLSIHLRFGTVSIRQLAQVALKKSEVWLNELIWRDFYQMILWHFPHTDKAFKPAYDRIAWRNNPNEFQTWCDGITGYPIVDAGMRELNETGFMHNRVRMIVASFLTKHLLIDWRWGEAYFAKKLLDFDLAANNGGWQWAAGSGCDAAPYFRVFNPYLQTEKFDPEMKYIKKWVPELGTKDYPSPIVEHDFARKRVLKVYKEALDPRTF